MWLILAFLSAALLGFYDSFKKKALEGNAVIPILFLNTLFSSLIFLPFIIVRTMQEYHLPQPEFLDERGSFIVKLYKYRENVVAGEPEEWEDKELILFCRTPRTRKEICEYLGLSSVSYAIQTHVMPLVEKGIIKMSIPEKPKSPKQLFYCD